MYGIELNKGVDVISVKKIDGKKRVKYMRGSLISEATVRVNQLGEEYFLCQGLRIFLDDLYKRKRKMPERR